MIPGPPGRDGVDGKDGKDGKSMEFVDASVQIAACSAGTADAATVTVPVLVDENGRSNASLYQALFNELMKLRTDGKIKCALPPGDPGAGPFWEYFGECTLENPVWISPMPIYMEMSGVALEIIGDIPDRVRYYVLAGDQTEMGIGNISFCSLDFEQFAPFIHVSTKQTRIMRPFFDTVVPDVYVRVSLKPGTQFRVFDPGDRWM